MALAAPEPASRLSAARPRLPPLTLVLGGARSGKSRYAETLIEDALAPGVSPLYLATAEPGDAEMAERIRRHRARRGPGWHTLEVPLALAPALIDRTRLGQPVLVDCLSLWLANILGAARPVDEEIDRLAACLPDLGGPVVLVSNEVGLGIVPVGAPARAFRDHAGRLHQRVAAAAARVVMVTAGLPLILKDTT